MKINTKGNVSIPPIIKSGPAELVSYLNMLRRSIVELRGRVAAESPHVFSKQRARSLEVFNLTSESPEEGVTEYKVNIRPGYVVERVVLAETDSVVYWEPDGIFDDEDPTKLKEYTIAAGQAVYVQVEVTKLGAIGIEPEVPPLDPPPPPVFIAVLANDEESTHFEPPIGTSEGSPGTYYYKLAELVNEDGEVKLKRFMGGYNIDHWLDLPTFKVRAGANPWKEWNGEEGIYYTKGFIGAGQITLTENADDLTYQGNKRNLEVRFRESGASEPDGEETLNFEDGLSMDGEVDAAPATERDVILPIVSGLSPITVTRTGEGDRNFQVGYDGEEFPGGGNLKLSKTTVTYDSVNDAFFPTGSPEYYYWKNGLYVGQTSPFDPGDPFDELDIASPEVS